MIFQPEMVRAYRREVDPKTQTRRMSGLDKVNENPDAWGCFSCDPDGRWVFVSATEETQRIRCPYGVAGDHIYCRETWKTGKNLDNLSPKKIGEQARAAGYSREWGPVLYLADGDVMNGDVLGDFGGWGKTRVSIHMPRWASRDTLEVLSAVPQRLQGITEADAKAEGCEPWKFGPEQCMTSGERGAESPYRGGYACLWDDINEDVTWFKNPWVWKVTFRRLGAENRGMK